jgi:hypothetical protein
MSAMGGKWAFAAGHCRTDEIAAISSGSLASCWSASLSAELISAAFP